MCCVFVTTTTTTTTIASAGPTRWWRLGTSHEATDTLHQAMFLAPYQPHGMVIAITVESVTFYFFVD